MGDPETMERLEGVRAALFDLDNTLYPRERGVFDRVSGRIDKYVARLTGRSGEQVRSLRSEYIRSYGTTLGGLMEEHGVDPEEYMDYVHDVPIEEMLHPDADLSAFLGSIDLPLLIFTNATRTHADRVLDALGVRPLFHEIVDLGATGYIGKPDRRAYLAALQAVGCEPGAALFVDDVPVNIHAAREMGILTAHVAEDGEGVGHFNVRRVVDLGEAFNGAPWLIYS